MDKAPNPARLLFPARLVGLLELPDWFAACLHGRELLPAGAQMTFRVRYWAGASGRSRTQLVEAKVDAIMGGRRRTEVQAEGAVIVPGSEDTYVDTVNYFRQSGGLYVARFTERFPHKGYIWPKGMEP